MKLQKFDFVSWLDISIRLKDAISYFKRARRHEIMVSYGYGSIAVRTQQRLLKHFKKISACSITRKRTGVMIVSRSCTTLKYKVYAVMGCMCTLIWLYGFFEFAKISQVSRGLKAFKLSQYRTVNHRNDFNKIVSPITTPIYNLG